MVRVAVKEITVSKITGYLDSIKNNFLSGWIAADSPEDVFVYCNGEAIGNLTELFIRQDVIDAGFALGEAGFKYDLNDYLKDKCGDLEFVLKVANELITSKVLYVSNGISLIQNSFFNFEDQYTLANINIDVSHRVGTKLERFYSPVHTQPNINAYTRISFGDSESSRLPFEMTFDLNSAETANNNQPLYLKMLAKASHDTNLHVRFLDQNNFCLLDEPLLAINQWESRTLILPSELSTKIKLGKVTVVLRTKHHGRRFVDLAMLVLTDDVEKCSLSEANVVEQLTHQEGINTTNLLKNGELTAWTKGITLGKVTRGQELADNWFVEMSQTNKEAIHASVSSIESKLPPYNSEFGLKLRVNTLDGYARLICPLNISQLSVVDYRLELDIASKSSAERMVLPRVFFVARNTLLDKQVSVTARKTVVIGRQKLCFDISAKEIQTIIKNSGTLPVMVLALDLPSFAEMTVFSASLAENLFDVCGDTVVNDTLIPDNLPLVFEDSSITEQLHLLKGLDNWSSDSAAPIQEVAIETIDSVAESLGEFKANILKLFPHKMSRPSRTFPFIDIIVPVYNACEDVLLCLSALVEKTDLVHRVIVINDGQESKTAEMLAAFQSSYNHIEVLTNPENIGYTRSVNKGIEYSNSDWVVVLNSDTIVSEGWLGKLMNCALSEEKVGMVGALSNAASWQSVPEIRDEKGDWHLNPLPEAISIDAFANMVAKHSTRNYPNVGVINGFCQLISMAMLDDIGLLDAVAFPIGYGEENDMCARAVKAGYKLLIADDTYVFHAKSKSFGHEKRKALAKQGSIALKKKHPDVDWNQVTQMIKDNVELNELRKQLTIELSNSGNGQ